jgi:hypothetical protein
MGTNPDLTVALLLLVHHECFQDLDKVGDALLLGRIGADDHHRVIPIPGESLGHPVIVVGRRVVRWMPCR